MRTIFQRICLVAGAAVLLAGCAREIGDERGGKGYDGIQFDLSIGAMTRVTTEGTSYRSEWEAGDKIGIYAVKAGTALLVSGNHADNVCLSFDGTDWSIDSPIYYPLDAKLDFYAYYPYDGALTSPLSINVTPKTDQSAQDDFDSSEFLSAVAMGQEAMSVQLSFTHAMALVEVRADRVSPVPGFRKGDFSVTLHDVYTEVDFNLSTQNTNIDWSTVRGDVKMYPVETTNGSFVYRALVPAQQKAPGVMFGFEQYSASLPTLAEINMVYKNDAAVEMKGGDAAVWAITLDYGLNKTHKYKVGDVYPHKGTPLGVVYWLDDTHSQYDPATRSGTVGKIVSLDEGSLAWGSINVDTGARSTTDGLDNMAEAKNFVNAFNYPWRYFPAFEWVDLKNGTANTTNYASGMKGIWYIPAENELGTGAGGLNYEIRTYGKDAFNARLTVAGGETLKTEVWYWSSSESGSEVTSIKLFDNSGGASIAFKAKVEQCSVRAVMAFGEPMNNVPERLPDGQFKVGDYWPDRYVVFSDVGVVKEGTPPEGVVFWIDTPDANGAGTSGKIVSLDEGTSLAWGGNDVNTGAQNRSNGLSNMTAVKTLDNTFGAYPAFAWSDVKNGPAGTTVYASGMTGVWYLPARDELLSVYNAWNGYGRGSFDGIITTAGGTGFTPDYYWASSEAAYSGNFLLSSYINFFDGIATWTNGRVIACRVRAVMAF